MSYDWPDDTPIANIRVTEEDAVGILTALEVSSETAMANNRIDIAEALSGLYIRVWEQCRETFYQEEDDEPDTTSAE